MRCGLPVRAGMVLAACGAGAWAQQPIGTVEAATATVSGTLSLENGRAALGGNAVVTARDRSARVQLTRGGEIVVCATSALHTARGKGAAEPAPLLMALDRGAVELHMPISSADSILTPDLRFAMERAKDGPATTFGLIDLTLRVAPNGDTCVDNQGSKAPTLEVSEQFGTGVYLVRPGQHVLFEHGSLREVVDGESSPCGCPAPVVQSVADAGHPFPAAESQGLTPAESAAPSVPQAPAGEAHAQVAATLGYSGDGSSFDGTGPAPASGSAGAAASAGARAAAPAAAPAKVRPATHGFLGRVGGFFRRVFGG